MGLGAFVRQAAHWRVMADLALLSLFAGLYSVPMYALIQLRSAAHAPRPHHRRQQHPQCAVHDRQLGDRRRAARRRLHDPADLPVHRHGQRGGGVLHLPAGARVPAALHRLGAVALVYRFEVRGDEHIPAEGAAVLVCNHVSFVDAMLLMAASPRPIRFMMDHRIFQVPVLGWLFKLAKAIPIAPQKEDPAVYEAAFERAAQVLREGDLLAIFPEGGHHARRQLQPFKGGVMKISEARAPKASSRRWCRWR
jgi:1-acyl-sn-glycerol-3-phosphate acyltransferase